MALNTSTKPPRTPTGPTSIMSSSSGGGFTNLASNLFHSGVMPNVNIKRPIVGMPDRGSFGTASREGMDETKGEMNRSAGEFNDPTSSGAFKNLMRLANETTGAQVGEVNRHLRDAASRRGYAGGFESDQRAAGRDRMAAIAQSGFEGADRIRDQAAKMYESSSGAFAKLAGDYNAGQTSRDVSYGDARAQAQQKQAELDSAFNNQLIDKARYTQMSDSLAMQLQREQARLKEDTRRFNLTREDQLAEAERLRRERGVDPTTGEHYGASHIRGTSGFGGLGRIGA